MLTMNNGNHLVNPEITNYRSQCIQEEILALSIVKERINTRDIYPYKYDMSNKIIRHSFIEVDITKELEDQYYAILDDAHKQYDNIKEDRFNTTEQNKIIYLLNLERILLPILQYGLKCYLEDNKNIVYVSDKYIKGTFIIESYV